jgi:hypothetical protein
VEISWRDALVFGPLNEGIFSRKVTLLVCH